MDPSAPVTQTRWGDRIGQRPEFLVAFPRHRFDLAQSLFGALAIGDVSNDFRGADDLAPGVGERRDGQRNIELMAMLGNADHLVMIDALSRSDPRQQTHFLFSLVGRNEQRDRLPSLCAIAELMFGPGVSAGDRSIEGLAENGVGRGGDDRHEMGG